MDPAKKEPWNDPGPSWKELQPPTQWRVRTLLVATAVIGCFCAGWVRSDIRFAGVGVAMIVVGCFLFNEWRLAVGVLICAGIPVGVLMALNMLIEHALEGFGPP